MGKAQVRRLTLLAYEQGWRDACDDHLQQNGTRDQAGDPSHPIGTRHRRDVDTLLGFLDPHNLLGLRPRG